MTDQVELIKASYRSGLPEMPLFLPYKSPPIALSVITCDKWIGINPIILHQDTWIINELQKSDHYL